ncbi:MAG: PIN domain-containing protein [Omnitrophica WOR_2 bacterium]
MLYTILCITKYSIQHNAICVNRKREPYFADAARAWGLAESRQIEGFIAGRSFTTLFYLYRHQGGSEMAYQAIRMLLRVSDVASVDRGTIEKACDLAWRDFEDAVQAVAASGAGCDYLVTRNPRNYAGQAMTIIQPAKFLAVWAARKA